MMLEMMLVTVDTVVMFETVSTGGDVRDSEHWWCWRQWALVMLDTVGTVDVRDSGRWWF